MSHEIQILIQAVRAVAAAVWKKRFFALGGFVENWMIQRFAPSGWLRAVLNGVFHWLEHKVAQPADRTEQPLALMRLQQVCRPAIKPSTLASHTSKAPRACSPDRIRPIQIRKAPPKRAPSTPKPALTPKAIALTPAMLGMRYHDAAQLVASTTHPRLYPAPRRSALTSATSKIATSTSAPNSSQPSVDSSGALGAPGVTRRYYA
ncbi:hypothetical protein B0G84_8339 [Paraburkholderia sp. BL8N3]|nr:hypothetical protein B0G84_8339 [Paraburkholderia sp. BL8N3]